MKIIRVSYFALAASVFAASCSKEAAEPDVYDWLDGSIHIRPSFVGNAYSRAQDMTLERLESFQVTCFDSADFDNEEDGLLHPYFEDIRFIRDSRNDYSSYSSYDWPLDSKKITFYAFSPSIEVMVKENPDITGANKKDFFRLQHSSEGDTTSVSIGYRLERMRVNPDISKQYDFITSDVSGYHHVDFIAGVDLAFRHQMSQVEVRAWGAHDLYNIDIAGIRFGNPTVEDTFIFSDPSDPEAYQKWDGAGDPVRGMVEYCYVNTDGSGGREGSGDGIFRIRKDVHSTEGGAETIMGLGGCAMVIPGSNEKWEGLEDPKIEETPYKTDKMYLSVLMRISDKVKGEQKFPYLKNREGIHIVTYAVNESGQIIYRLYPGKKDGEYFTDQWLSNRYTGGDGLEVMEFGWAAVPIDMDWKAGKRYVYTLDYTNGFGVNDPEDPEPGKPILGETPITWSVNVTEWEYAGKDENFDPDLDVP